MRLLSFYICLLFPHLLPAANLDLDETLNQIRARHNALESYFAVYEGTAPGGKSINAVIAYHREAKLAAVQAQFLVEGKVLAAPLQAATPELGLVLGGARLVHLEDASRVLEKLSHIVAILYNNDESPLGDWSPALSLKKDTAAAQLTISAKPQMPWLRGSLPEGSNVTKSATHFLFQTPDKATYQVQADTGILQKQVYPNQDGERTLVLKSLEINLSEEELSVFVKKIIPPAIPKKSIRNHGLFGDLQLQALQKLIELVDTEQIVLAQVEERLQKSQATIQDYLSTVYPDAATQLAGPDKWKEAIALHSSQDQTTQVKELASVVMDDWKIPLLLNSADLTCKSDEAKQAALLLCQTFNQTFLQLAVEQALAEYSQS